MAKNESFRSLFILFVILTCCLLPAGTTLAASSTVTLQASELIDYGTQPDTCYYHGYNLPCQQCACFMSMAESQGGVQCVRASSDGYYLLGYLQEGYLEPVDEMTTIVINMFVLKTDFAGKVQWFTPVRGLAGTISYPGDLLATPDGGCILIQKRIVETKGVYVEADRLDASGNLSWQAAIGSGTEPRPDPDLPTGNDCWITSQPDGNFYALWNTDMGERWATIDGSGALTDTGTSMEQTHPGSIKQPELTASYGDYSVSVEAPVTRITMTLEQPGTSNSNNDSSLLHNLIPVLVDGIPVIFPDVQPFVSAENRILVPLRPALEAMGVTVTWSGESNQALLSDGATNVIFTLNSQTYMVNQTPMQMDTAPVVYNDRIMLPIRFAAEAFGALVTWQNDSVIITTL